jgi:hypothetical protein
MIENILENIKFLDASFENSENQDLSLEYFGKIEK